MDAYLDRTFLDLDPTSDLATLAAGLGRIDSLFREIALASQHHPRPPPQPQPSFADPSAPAAASFTVALDASPTYARYSALQAHYAYNVVAKLIAVVARLVAEYRRNTWALHAFDDGEDEYDEEDSTTSSHSASGTSGKPHRKVTRTVSVANMMAGQGVVPQGSTKTQGTGRYAAGLGSARAAAASVYRATASRGSVDDSVEEDDDDESGVSSDQSLVSGATWHRQQAHDSETWERMQSVAQTLAQLGSALEHALDLLQGALLLHAPSRGLYARKAAMLGLLELLVYDKQVASQVSGGGADAAAGSSHGKRGGSGAVAPLDESSLVIMHLPQIQVAAISTLVSAMVHEPATIRQFEQCDGVAVMCRLFRASQTPKDVKLRILEFLFFYLIPECQSNNGGAPAGRKTTREKANGLRKYLGNVDGLLEELEVSKPFGNLDNIDW